MKRAPIIASKNLQYISLRVFWLLGGHRNPPELAGMFDLPSWTEHRVMLGSCEKVKLVSAGRAASGAQPAFVLHFRT